MEVQTANRVRHPKIFAGGRDLLLRAVRGQNLAENQPLECTDRTDNDHSARSSDARRYEVGSANGIRTRVSALRGRCPRPLDDSAEDLCCENQASVQNVRWCYFRMVHWLEQATVFAARP